MVKVDPLLDPVALEGRVLRGDGAAFGAGMGDVREAGVDPDPGPGRASIATGVLFASFSAIPV